MQYQMTAHNSNGQFAEFNGSLRTLLTLAENYGVKDFKNLHDDLVGHNGDITVIIFTEPTPLFVKRVIS